MELLAALEASAPATGLRQSVWLYPLVNAAHIAGIALLFGAIVPLDLRLLGLWPGEPASALARVLVPVATAGLVLAVVAGALLFSARATEYAASPLFLIKMALVALGTVNALALRRSPGWHRLMAGTSRVPPGLLGPAMLSLATWGGALLLGRLVGYF